MPFNFCPTLEELFNSKEVVGESGKSFHTLNGLSTRNNILLLRQLMLDLKPKNTLEIGLACGGSALTFAQTHHDLGASPNKQHIAIDAYQSGVDNGFDNVGRLQLEKAGLFGFVDVRERLSCYELPAMCQSGQQFQLVYIDGSHQFEDVFCDFYFVSKMTSVGGFILFDDSSDKEVAKVISFIQSNLENFYQHIPLHTYKSTLTTKIKYLLGENLHKTQLTIFRKISDDQRFTQKLKRF